MVIKASMLIEYDPKDIKGTLLKEIEEVVVSFGYEVKFTKLGEQASEIDLGEKIKNKIPEDIKELDRSAFSMALLTVMKRYHVGEKEKAYSKEIAKEIISDFPEIAEEYNYKLGKVSFAIIFAMDNGRGGLVRDEYVKMDYDEEKSRRYWIGN